MKEQEAYTTKIDKGLLKLIAQYEWGSISKDNVIEELVEYNTMNTIPWNEKRVIMKYLGAEFKSPYEVFSDNIEGLVVGVDGKWKKMIGGQMHFDNISLIYAHADKYEQKIEEELNHVWKSKENFKAYLNTKGVKDAHVQQKSLS